MEINFKRGIPCRINYPLKKLSLSSLSTKDSIECRKKSDGKSDGFRELLPIKRYGSQRRIS
jgi:hypothetical protein